MQITNSAGFVGIQYIDDSFDYPGYCLDIAAQKRSGLFSFALSFLSANGTTAGLPIYIEWNSAVRRYQSTSYDDPPKFEAEVKNPPHIKTGRHGK